MEEVSQTGGKRTGKNRQRIESALLEAGKRTALASEMGISEGQLSKMINGRINQWCKLLELLGLEIREVAYIKGLERLLKEIL